MRLSLPSGTSAELAAPPAEPTMGLVVAPDIFGLRPLYDDLCARLARQQGWAVCAVEPFPGKEHLDIDGRFEAVPFLDDRQVLADLVAAADATGCGRVGILGFCMGGMYTLKASSTGRFDAAAAFYGMIRLPVAWRGPGQGEPLDAVARATCDVLAVVGAKDPYTPADDIAALQSSSDRVTVIEYPDAEHGFVHDPDRPAHRPADAADAWSRAIPFLAG